MVVKFKFHFGKLFLSSVIMALCCLVSCHDDDDKLSSQLEAQLIEKAWQSNVEHDLLFWGDEEASISKEVTTLYFLGNNEGIGKRSTKEIDTYFGTSSKSVPYKFNYNINGNTLTINGLKLTYKDNMLVSSDGSVYFKPISIDKQWLESAKYYLMSDSERLKFDFSYGCEEISVEDLGEYYICTINLFIGVKAEDRAHSRGCTMIKGEYHISNGTFHQFINGKGKKSKKVETQLFINSDADSEEIMNITVITESLAEAKITASFSIYDSKNKKTINVKTANYTVPANPTDNSDSSPNTTESEVAEEWDGVERNIGDSFTATTKEGVSMTFVVANSWFGNCVHIEEVAKGTQGPVTIPLKILGYDVRGINDKAFYQQLKITSVKIPYTIESIGQYAFYGCSSLESVEFVEPQGFGNNLKSIGYEAFAECTQLKEITLPNSILKIPVNGFYGCKNLRYIDTGNRVNEVGKGAFMNCENIEILILGKNMQYLFANPIYNDESGEAGSTTKIKSIKLRVYKPFTIKPSTFEKGNPTNGEGTDDIYNETKLIVPIGSKSAYENAIGWNLFKNIEEE